MARIYCLKDQIKVRVNDPIYCLDQYDRPVVKGTCNKCKNPVRKILRLESSSAKKCVIKEDAFIIPLNKRSNLKLHPKGKWNPRNEEVARANEKGKTHTKRLFKREKETSKSRDDNEETTKLLNTWTTIMSNNQESTWPTFNWRNTDNNVEDNHRSNCHNTSHHGSWHHNHCETPSYHSSYNDTSNYTTDTGSGGGFGGDSGGGGFGGDSGGGGGGGCGGD